jgi:hypothetical protein
MPDGWPRGITVVTCGLPWLNHSFRAALLTTPYEDSLKCCRMLIDAMSVDSILPLFVISFLILLIYRPCKKDFEFWIMLGIGGGRNQ